MVKKLKILFVLLAVQASAFAQLDNVAMALEYFQKGAFVEGKAAIDKAVNDPSAANDSYAWYVRGFIYKEIYKQTERNNPESLLREVALNSFIQSIEVDKEKEHTAENEGNLRFLSNTFYNDAATYLNKDYKIAIKNFESHKKTLLQLNDLTALAVREIEFKLALASVFTSIYEKDRVANKDFFNKINNLYNEVLVIDPDNVSANYNMGIMYYNKAVNIINEMDYDVDIFALMEIQEETANIFKESLPYMEKAYSLNPQKKETLKGLEGIYFSLNEFEKSNEIKARLESLD
jgi:tetratricopeptide (TPR) repeat protein